MKQLIGQTSIYNSKENSPKRLNSPDLNQTGSFLKASQSILQTYDATRNIKNVYINEDQDSPNRAKAKKKRIIIIKKKKHRDGSISKER